MWIIIIFHGFLSKSNFFVYKHIMIFKFVNLSTSFLFRITNDMGPSSSGAFLAPFEIDVWIAILVTFILVYALR